MEQLGTTIQLRKQNQMKNQDRVRVLHIITNLAVGGAQDNMLMTLERLNRHKYDVSLSTSSEGEWLPRAKSIKELNLVFLDSFKRNISPIQDLITLYRVYLKIKKGGYAIVQTHTSKAGVLGRIAARLAGVPIVLHTHHGLNFHDYLNPVLRFIFFKLERFLANISDKLITVSQLNLKKAFDAGLAPLNKFVNIYNGIDFEKFDLQVDIPSKRKAIGVFGKEKIVGTVGRLCAQKAPQDLIRAIPKILVARKEVVFIFVGDGELQPQMQALSKRLGVDSHVKFLGNREDVPELLHIMDVFVLTSLWEGMPRSLTEAMYCARPVVATAVDGTSELVTNAENGILVQPKDTEALSQGILTLLNDRVKAKQLGEAAKKRVAESFAVEKMVREIERLYDDLLHQKGLFKQRISHEYAQNA
jgi:glycosyltransferase involved in cell wall biosynthesis